MQETLQSTPSPQAETKNGLRQGGILGTESCIPLVWHAFVFAKDFVEGFGWSETAGGNHS
jgi:hypothetical protein